MGSKMLHKLLQDAGYVRGANIKARRAVDLQSPAEGGAGGAAPAASRRSSSAISKKEISGPLPQILVVLTGALFSPLTCQRESIPCIAHALVIEEG